MVAGVQTTHEVNGQFSAATQARLRDADLGRCRVALPYSTRDASAHCSSHSDALRRSSGRQTEASTSGVSTTITSLGNAVGPPSGRNNDYVVEIANRWR